MRLVGHIESLWRYPIKSMGGESPATLCAGPGGIEGDRLLAFESAGAALGKPLLTGAERNAMLRCRARYAGFIPATEDEQTAFFQQPRLGALVEVRTPDGTTRQADNPELIVALQAGLAASMDMFLRQSDRPLTDCRPIGLMSTGTLRQLTEEMGFEVRADRFRANLMLELLPGLQGGARFAEDAFVGKQLRFGEHTTLLIKERDPRCRIITIDPETGVANPALMRQLARQHEGRAGIYAATVVPGPISVGDPIMLLD